MMKPRIALAMLSIALLASTCSTAQAQCQYPTEPSISTQGTGEVKVRPDSLSLSVSVESKAPTLSKARTDNNEKMARIIAGLKSLGIANMKLETQNLNVYPIQSEYVKDKLPRVIGYQVTNSLQIQVTGEAADKLGEDSSRIVDSALNSGATNTGGLNFYLSDMKGPRSQALVNAIQDARRNAEAMAQAAGTSIKGIMTIEGTPQYSTYMPRGGMMMMKASVESSDQSIVPAPIETGETTVTGNVTIRFRI